MYDTYNWSIVESGVKHNRPSSNPCMIHITEVLLKVALKIIGLALIQSIWYKWFVSDKLYLMVKIQ
jgi:hypothetical protein